MRQLLKSDKKTFSTLALSVIISFIQVSLLMSVLITDLTKPRQNVAGIGDSPIYIATTGSDTTGDGTIGNPYATLNHASDNANPGDTIYVRAGTYNLTNQTQWEVFGFNATESNQLYILPYNNETVIVDGTNANIPESRGIVQIMNSNWITFQGFEVRNAPNGRGVNTYESTYITIKDNIVHDTGHKAIGISGDNITIDGNEVYAAAKFNEDRAQNDVGWEQAISTYLRVESNTPTTNTVIKNNYIHDNWGEGIDFIYADGGIAENNILHDNFSVNIYVDTSKNITIRNNYIYNETLTFYRLIGGEVSQPNAIQFANELDNTYNTQIDNIDIYNNVIGDDIRRGVNYFQDKGSYKNISIVNNTFADSIQHTITFDSGGSDWGTNEIRNNIVKSPGEVGFDPVNIPSAQRSSFSFSNNLWIDNDEPGYASDITDQTGSPVYVGTTSPTPANGNAYAIGASSPARDNGIVSSLLSTDFDGVARDVSPDIGAFEYSSGIAIPVASFSADVTSGTVPLTVTFTDSSTNSPTGWAWDFDYNGSTDSTQQNPTYTFNSAGTYAVSLRASNSGGSNTHIKTNFIVVASQGGESRTSIYRFFNRSIGSHFYTVATNERDDVINLLSDIYIYEGAKFTVFKQQETGTIPAYRMFNRANGAHLYTTATNERDDVLQNIDSFIYEGISYYVYPTAGSGRKPVYRFFNTLNGSHIYTDAENEKNNIQLKLPMFVYEGVAFYVPE